MRLVVSLVDKVKTFEKMMEYLETHPEEVKRRIDMAMNEFVEKLADVKQIGFGDDVMFESPSRIIVWDDGNKLSVYKAVLSQKYKGDRNDVFKKSLQKEEGVES